MPPPDPAYLLATVRRLTAVYQAGGPAAFQAFRDLAFLLLSVTVLRTPPGGVRLIRIPGRPEREALGGWSGPDDPLPLNDGHFLRLSVALYLEHTTAGARLKVAECSYQYQPPPHAHPAAHLQVRGELTEPYLPEGTSLARVHFPTGRVPLEAVIRLLAEQFRVPCNTAPEVWRPALAESERAFLEIAHHPLSGPEV